MSDDLGIHALQPSLHDLNFSMAHPASYISTLLSALPEGFSHPGEYV